MSTLLYEPVDSDRDRLPVLASFTSPAEDPKYAIAIPPFLNLGFIGLESAIFTAIEVEQSLLICQPF